MKYMGGKCRLAKQILPIILKGRLKNQYYVEPFCGGCNTLSEVNELRIGADINKYLIGMWQKVSTGWIPPRYVYEDDYNLIKANKDEYDYALVGYYGFQMSYGGKWFGGFSRTKKDIFWDKIRDHALSGYNASLKQFPKLKGVTFVLSTYDELTIPDNSIIYCDPPYANTTKYNNVFDSDKFWDWCRFQKSKGHTIFISEYFAPDDFICVWQKERKSSLTRNRADKISVEKLFTI